MTDEVLKNLLRSAVPPLGIQDLEHDLWPTLAARIEARPSWSWVDLTVAAGLGVALVLFPRTLPLLAYLL
jgi:hypothetical protein